MSISFDLVSVLAENNLQPTAWENIGRWIYHVSPALVAVGIGAFGVNKFFIRRANGAAFVDRICGDLKDLASDLLEYWSFDSSDTNAYRRNQVLAQKIKGSLQAINRDLRLFSEKYHKRKASEFIRLMVELTDAATGGDFESGNQTFRPEKYIVITNRIGEIRSLLMATKI